MLRNQFLNLLRSQKEEDRFKKSKIIGDKFFSAREVNEAQTILFYASFDGEVETFEMIKQAKAAGKTVVLPIIIKDQKRIIPTVVHNLNEDLHDGPYGIKQPKETNSAITVEKIDVVVVPGIAFDSANYRLGRGHGYYDRFLSSIPSRIPTFGLAFDFQVVDRLPFDSHDIQVSRVIVN